jgi:hypothetical protein
MDMSEQEVPIPSLEAIRESLMADLEADAQAVHKVTERARAFREAIAALQEQYASLVAEYVEAQSRPHVIAKLASLGISDPRNLRPVSLAKPKPPAKKSAPKKAAGSKAPSAGAPAPDGAHGEVPSEQPPA